MAAQAKAAALEAENAALKARVAELVEGLKPLAKIGGEIDRFAPQLHDEDGTSVAIGDLRRARALLQGGPDAMRGDAPLFDAGRRALEDTADDR